MSDRPVPTNPIKAHHIVSVDRLNDEELDYILELSAYYGRLLAEKRQAPQRLIARTQINLFYEDSTRTNMSFDLAGQKLGADVLNVPVSASSVNKGEGLIDTVQTFAAMGADVMIVRQSEEGVLDQICERVDCAVINGGDGAREHPTQALLDAVAIRTVHDSLKGLTIAICGDIKHSRVAGSDAALFQRLGAHVRFVGPSELMPDSSLFPDVPRFASLKDGLDGADIVMGLRMQFERMSDPAAIKSRSDAYFAEFGLTHETLKLAKPGAWIMHPGPMNRSVEIDGSLADDPARSLILRQVFCGVATRMACLDAIVTKGMP
ncbi:MAG: aspartate carbamoyltransferase catalytic subunit [Pseudomonadota bacterium]